jgi:hypothetical protein
MPSFEKWDLVQMTNLEKDTDGESTESDIIRYAQVDVDL